LGTNLKELLQIIRSILIIQILSIKYGFADITVCAVAPEKHLYLLWMPFSKVIYILHTTPDKKYTSFTSYTCNVTLGKRKKMITVSNSNKDLICENWNISDKKKPLIYVIYNCVIENELNGENKGPVENKEQYIVTLGHVVSYKNPSLWLEVAKSVTAMRKQVHFIWLGNGPLWHDFKDATLENKRITFQGSVSDPDAYLKNAIIYYQPSLHETHGIAVLEAMYNYLPCVVSNVGGLPESVQDKNNGLLVDPTDTKKNTDALISLIDNPHLCRLYGQNGHKRYRKLFSFDAFRTEMDVIY
jgi:glycosyltransferase involved in cell wall biosynthesis